MVAGRADQGIAVVDPPVEDRLEERPRAARREARDLVAAVSEGAETVAGIALWTRRRSASETGATGSRRRWSISPLASTIECIRTFDSALSKCWSGIVGVPSTPSQFFRPVSCQP